MYNVEVFTKRRQDTNTRLEYVYKKTEVLPAVYDKGTHYVTNQKLTLEMLKEISNSENIVRISGEYTGCYVSVGALHELRKRGDSSKYSFYG